MYGETLIALITLIPKKLHRIYIALGVWVALLSIAKHIQPTAIFSEKQFVAKLKQTEKA